MKNLSKVLNEKDIATKEYVDTASSNKANIDSPVFTGKPKAPTPAPTSAGNQIATKSYVDPVALDTTNTYTYSYFRSLADHNKDVIINGYKVSRMWTDNIKATFDLVESFNVTGCFTYYYNGNKWEYENMTLAPIESPTFSGAPKAPTPTNDSDGTQIATKEYVDPVILDTTKTYTYAYFKSLADANRRVKVGGRNISRVFASEAGSYFYYMEEPSNTGYFVYFHTPNRWEQHETPVAEWASVIEEFANFVPTKIKNQNNVGISIWTGTQEEYNALTTKDANTLYLVKSS